MRHLATALALWGALSAFATSAKDKRERKGAEAILREPAQAVRQSCASKKLKVEMDWPSFRGAIRDNFSLGSAAGFCGTVLDGVRQSCVEGDRKPAALRRLKTVRCSFRKEAFRFQAELKGSTLYAYYSWETPNLAEETQAWLKNLP